ncbi:MAG: HlyD family efflux transporter periplasmic adaptor subunit [Bacteroidia bacterium]|nr:HlyD family efflux transporter periplasmic adaptor subunit [Bacteroidia bacterium]
MPDRYNLEAHSEEVEEIMSFIPNRVIRWGLTVIFAVLASLLIGSYCFKSPEIIIAPMILTTKNPPVSLISKSTGKIDRLFAVDGQTVSEKENIALINNPTDFSHYLILKKELADCFRIANWDDQVFAYDLSDQLTLGELQESYGPFLKNRNNFRHYLTQNFLPQKIGLVNKQIAKQEEYYQTLIRQREVQRNDLTLCEKSFIRDSSLYQKRTTSEAEYEKSRQLFLSKKSAFIGFEAVLKGTESSILQLQSSRVELQMQHERELSEFRLSLDEGKQNLENAIHQWKEKYLVASPVKGKLTFTSIWSVNQEVKTGELIATVIPIEESTIIAKAVIPPSGFGKVEVGQRVNLKLNGFPYMEFGMLKGNIRSISLVPEARGYVAEIELSGGMTTSYRENLKFIRQMDGTAEIITKEMRLITRLINPLRAFFDNGK